MTYPSSEVERLAIAVLAKAKSARVRNQPFMVRVDEPIFIRLKGYAGRNATSMCAVASEALREALALLEANEKLPVVPREEVGSDEKFNR